MVYVQDKLNFSPYAVLYDKIVPKNRPLLRIKDMIAFRFVKKELLDKYCLDNGRMAKPPIMIFKLLLIKCLTVKNCLTF